MRSLSILLLIGLLVVLIHSRPSQTDENNESDIEEAEYGSDDKDVAPDFIDDNSRLNEDPGKEDTDQSGKMAVKKNSYEQSDLAESSVDRPNADISDYKPFGNRDTRKGKVEEPNNYDELQNYAKRRQYSRYTENKDATDQQEAAQHLTNRNVNYFKTNRNHNNMLSEDPLTKREEGVKVNEQRDGVYRNDRRNRDDFNSEPLALSQRYSKYYTQMKPENKELVQCKNREGHLYFNRDRRETKNTKESTDLNADTDKNTEDKAQTEDEEMAIRRHIKKLSSDELQELLSSLSEEKRTLLKAIISDTDPTVDVSENMNKREITKKAGAIEENSCIESGQADSSNIHEDSASVDMSTEAAAQNTESTEATKQTSTSSENTDSSNTKSTTDTNSGKVGPQIDEAVQQKSDNEASDVSADKTQAELAPNEHVTTKNENKRETNMDDLADIVSFEDPKVLENDWFTGDSKEQEGYFCSNDEDLSQFLDSEPAVANDGSKIYKRDVETQAAYESKMKSLEESFPKSQNYDETVGGGGPLIRVKRKNSEAPMKKRAAAISPDAKVAFFPYRAENDDEDTDEGNEFEEDGFYDRTPNFSSNDANDNKAKHGLNCNSNERASRDMKGTNSLGSDTDSVLSGVEGVDETLMFSSGSRNRRTSEDLADVDDTNVIQSHSKMNEETKPIPDINALTYQEDDSFGPLPRNNEDESGRYKRIRRVKQSRPENAADP